MWSCSKVGLIENKPLIESEGIHKSERSKPLIESEGIHKSERRYVNVLRNGNFQDSACHLIHESKEPLDGLVCELQDLLENEFFVGEKVSQRGDRERLYKVMEKISSNGGTKYKIEPISTEPVKTVHPSEISRLHRPSGDDIKTLIHAFVTERKDDHWPIKPHVRKYFEVGENCSKCGDPRSRMQKFGECVFIGKEAYVHLFGVENNAKLADESMELVAKMNRTTLDGYLKKLVANETINAVNHPLGAEGLAHMFWFESNLKNRTTLDEYIDRMKPAQQSIFYAYDDSKSEIEQMSIVQSLLKAGNEVLFVTNSLDKRVIDRVGIFRGKTFVDVKRVISTKNETTILDLRL
ncbi:Endoplasmin [Aphelenchoides besseyi]|nr:Endoplasmin [Aphelenchoides besseyi]